LGASEAQRSEDAGAAPRGTDDVLSTVLGTIRLSGSVQFCVAAAGTWQTEGRPALKGLAAGSTSIIPFHIVAEGGCWLTIEGRRVALAAGDVVAFPFGTGHVLGSGAGGTVIAPIHDLPPKPWRDIPLLRYGASSTTTQRVKLLCGWLTCDAMNFHPLKAALPALLHARTAQAADDDWLKATVRQIVVEAERPRTGSRSRLERLTEITFIELLRHEIAAAPPGATGWLAALADRPLGRCLAAIHDEPKRGWTVPALGGLAGLSRSALAERFETVLATSPMRYVRDWRLYLASVALATTRQPIAAIADEAGYGTEAAFNRAFSRAYGVPPSRWRRGATVAAQRVV
jgi:AraC-like DNA-binding protein